MTASTRARRGLALVVLVVALLAPPGTGAQTFSPTDVRRVDELIDAPRALFGRTRADIKGALGRALSEEVRELVYPGLTIRFGLAEGLQRVRITGPGYALPLGLNIGAARGDVERLLGEPQAIDDARYMYLYSDGYPDTVEFYFSDGRVRRIEWTYWVE